MRFFVIGATGKTGTQFLELALARGHDVTALVRDPARLAQRHAKLHVEVGSALDAGVLAALLPGHDAVLSTLGIKPRELFGPIRLLGDCAAATVEAMRRASVRRLGLVSAATLFPERGVMFTVLRSLFRNQIADLVVAEEAVRASGLDWTFARPPRLVKRRDEGWRAAVGTLPEGPRVMSFRAVAAFMLDTFESGRHVREVVGLSGGAA